jgi:hypothetical protein
MKQLLVVLAVIVTATMSCKDELKENKKAEMAVLNDTANFTTVNWLDTAVNFGTAKLGEKIQIKFRCQNTGTKPLIIINAIPGCGCTVANYTKQPIAPGAEGLITAEFDTQKAHGTSVTKYIIATTNTLNSDMNLMFKGEIIGGESNDKIAIPHEVTKKS